MLHRFWRKHPEWRLGQVVSNAARASGWPMENVFALPDAHVWFGLGVLAAAEKEGLREVVPQTPPD